MTVEEMLERLEQNPDAPKEILHQIANSLRETQSKADQIKVLRAELVASVKRTEAYITLLQRHVATQETAELVRSVRDDLDTIEEL